MITSREQLLEEIRIDAEDWHQVLAALEDGAYLSTLGDVSESIVEDAHDHARMMAQSHPEYKF
jgi:hypothetical protein